MIPLIAGIDLSLTGTGIILLQGEKILQQKLIKSKPTKTPLEEVKRLRGIIDGIPLALEGQKVTLAVIEGLAFMARNTTALVQLAGLSYLLRDELADYQIPFLIVAPTSLKKFAIGKGNAGKDEMMLAVFKKWGETLVNDNLSDAYALARVGEAFLLVNDDGHWNSLTKPQQEVIKLLLTQSELNPGKLYGKT